MPYKNALKRVSIIAEPYYRSGKFSRKILVSCIISFFNINVQIHHIQMALPFKHSVTENLDARRYYARISWVNVNFLQVQNISI